MRKFQIEFGLSVISTWLIESFLYCNVRQSANRTNFENFVQDVKVCDIEKCTRWPTWQVLEIEKEDERVQKGPTLHSGTRMSEMSSPRRRENQQFCHLAAKRQGFDRKGQMRPLWPEDEEWCQRQEADDRHRTVTVYFIWAYPHLFWLFIAYLDNVWPTRSSF